MGKGTVKPKSLYLGIFNYASVVEEVIRFAPSEQRAKTLMVQELARKHDVHPAHVAALFDGSRPNYTIKIEPEWKKKQDFNRLRAGEGKDVKSN